MPSTEPEHLLSAGKFIHVAAGVVENARGEILIAKRPDHLHQGGLWEFPGGKLKAGESVFSALQRELLEEVNLTIESAEPLIQIPWHYPDKSVMLEVLRISAYSGEAEGCEGQVIKWIKPEKLEQYNFPAANQAILTALSLPQCYMITGEFTDMDDFLIKLKTGLEQGIRLVQLRAKHASGEELSTLINQAKPLCAKHKAHLLVNTSVEIAQQHNVGIHLCSQRLMACESRPLTKEHLVGASVHNEKELQQANRLGLDFVVISPVLPTRSHPEVNPIGWDTFRTLTSQSSVPVYALGGVSTEELEHARQAGAQGIAAISAFWRSE